MNNNHYATVAVCLLLAGGLAACSSTDASKSAAAPATAQARAATKPKPQARAQSQSSLDALRHGDSAATPKDGALKAVFFEFDRYDLSSDARATLKAAADWLRNNPAVKVEVEGHCDDRGTNEYNLALGAKRAQAAKDYLVTLGVGAARLSTTSYGEEVPVCREHSEACWQKNRRDRFVALGAKPGV
ncbi:MAG TPA: peptidoglycan-associated lipoprotein Pal [Pseudolabrys sp.]|nr:peptidoglycan-associated lipoprotein Pal [Pseudolabrys sp.]